MTDTRPEILIVVGARPNFMKAGPVLHALRDRGHVSTFLVHTGQHYDQKMSDLFFEDLGLPRPDVNLDVGSGSHAEQTGQVMVRFEALLSERQDLPAFVVVVGDVNSTLACAIVAAKAGVPLAHVEAGLRSFDRGMPEELNRICTDQLADVCFVTESSGMENLGREGVPESQRLLVGNTMIDTLLLHRERARDAGAARRKKLGLEEGQFAICTLHRPSNVDSEPVLRGILEALEKTATQLPIVWPIHPRTLSRAESFGLAERLRAANGLRLVDPQGYLDFLGLMDSAALILTDSGGIQEEATVLKVPCVTLRENTERPITLQMGGNVLVGADAGRIVNGARKMLGLDRKAIGAPPLWDGRAAERIAEELERRVAAAGPPGGPAS